METILQPGHARHHVFETLVERQIRTTESEREVLLLRQIQKCICRFLPSYIVRDDISAGARKLKRDGFPDSSSASSDEEVSARK